MAYISVNHLDKPTVKIYNGQMPSRSSSTSSARKPRIKVAVRIPFRPRIPVKLNMVYLLVTIIIVGAFALGLVLGILITKVQYLEKGVGANTTTNTTGAAPDITTPVDVAVGHLPPQGDPGAKIKIIEFADFQCPFCEQFFTQTEPQVIKDYVNTGKAVFYFRHYAFLDQATDSAGPESTQAANASECANEQGKFWQYHDYLYSHQGQEDSGTFSIDNLKGFASTLGLNTDQFNSCLDAKKFQSNVDKDVADAGTAGVSGTPSIFVNGMLFSGACPYSDIKQAIDYTIAGTKFKISGSDNCTVSTQ